MFEINWVSTLQLLCCQVFPRPRVLSTWMGDHHTKAWSSASVVEDEHTSAMGKGARARKSCNATVVTEQKPTSQTPRARPRPNIKTKHGYRVILQAPAQSPQCDTNNAWNDQQLQKQSHFSIDMWHIIDSDQRQQVRSCMRKEAAQNVRKKSRRWILEKPQPQMAATQPAKDPKQRQSFPCCKLKTENLLRHLARRLNRKTSQEGGQYKFALRLPA